MQFFDNNKNIKENDKDYKTAISILDFLEKCFPLKDYKFLSKHAWVFSVYTMVRELSIGYALAGKENLFSKFIEEFHGKVYHEDFRQSNQNYQRFYDNVRGGWSEKIIKLRRTILIEEFLKKYNIEEKDEKRQISEEDKIACYTIHPNCQICGKEFKDYKEPEYHHKMLHSLGGKSSIENIMVLCSKCHDEMHGKDKKSFD